MEFLEWAKKNNWDVEVRAEGEVVELTSKIVERYGNLPEDWLQFFQKMENFSHEEGSCWFLTLEDYKHRDEDMMFSWNYIEQICEKIADGDEAAMGEVKKFWDTHFPILFDVSEVFRVYSIQLSDGCVVMCEEPLFLKGNTVATSFSDFLDKVKDGELLGNIQPI